MDEKKIMATEEVKNVEVIDETKKPKVGDRVKGFFKKHKKKIIGIALGGAGIAAGVAWNEHRKKLRAEEEADEMERTALAEDWYQRGLDAGRNALPEATDSEVTDDANEEES